MIQSPKLLWGEGLFLRPQHFQRQDAYHEWRLSQTARALHPYGWGVRHVRIDGEALASGVLRVLELQLVLPDGELYNAPTEDDLPDAISLGSLPPEQVEMQFHLALARTRAVGGNHAPSAADADTGVRFYRDKEAAADWFTQAVDCEILVLRKSARLIDDRQPRDHLVSLPVLQVRRTPTGGFELDPWYCAPSLSIDAAPTLVLQLRRLMDVLQAKVDALYGFHREPSQSVIEFRSGDVASFWLLHTASQAFASLSHLLRNPGLHPERLFQTLLGLAGALMTFSRTWSLADLPTYDHERPSEGFLKLDEIVRELLETVISTRYFSIALNEVKPSFHHGRIDSERITATSVLYLAVSASMPPSDLVEVVPMRFKVGAPDDVDNMVLSAMPGVKLVHAPQVPAAIPVRPGAYYFAVEGRGPLYERMLQSQTACIYVPSGIADLKLDLVAVSS